MKHEIGWYLKRLWRESRLRSRIVVIAASAALIALSVVLLLTSPDEKGFVVALWIVALPLYALVIALRIGEIAREDSEGEKDGDQGENR